MPILKVKNKETGQWEQVGVSTEATGAQIAAHNVAPDAHADIRQAIAELSAASVAMVDALAEQAKTFYATIGTNWTEDGTTGVKSQSIALDGVLASHTAKVDHVYTGDGTAASYKTYVEEENQFLSCITNGFAKTYDGGITFYIFDVANTVDIPIIVEVS
jgi:hypothetical protein